MAAKQPPPLMKKHSQTDLVSRLKTRKILGVGGEDDDGEVHRSKISQVLGNEIKFAVREPLGLSAAAQEDMFWWPAQVAESLSRLCQALAFPDQLFDAIFEEDSVSSKTPIRLYGGALLSECCTTVLGMLLPRRVRGQVAKKAAADKVPEHLLLAKKLLRGFFEKLGYCCFFLAGIQEFLNFLHLYNAVQDWGSVPQRIVLQAGTGQDLKLTPFLCQGWTQTIAFTEPSLWRVKKTHCSHNSLHHLICI
uniref:Tumor protein p53-inducible protein 11 n=1 Tax=Serinus canaria TaxID=9135 RepID=A0A8C9MIX5_SERCA